MPLPVSDAFFSRMAKACSASDWLSLTMSGALAERFKGFGKTLFCCLEIVQLNLFYNAFIHSVFIIRVSEVEKKTLIHP